MKYRRIKRHVSPHIKALADAQKIAFAPLTFQAVATMLKFGILEFLDENPSTVEQVIENCGVSKYTAETLLEVAYTCGIVVKTEDFTFAFYIYIKFWIKFVVCTTEYC